MAILITGAARGIGRGMFNHYAAQGRDVIGTCRSDAADANWQVLDVTDPASHTAMAQRLAGTPIDLLVCNAGVYLDKGHALDDGYPADIWGPTFAANVTGVFLTIQSLLPNLRTAENAKIAIISSTMASDNQAPGGSYIYRASKAAVLNLGRNLSADLQPEGVSVGIYHPGWVQTDMGGAQAAITVDEAVSGLTARFADLNIAKTGCFENWDGRPHAF